MSVMRCDPDLIEMRRKLAEARAAGHTRLFALAYDPESPLQWHHCKDEAEMLAYLDSRDESESILFNCAIAVVVVNPSDRNETIESVIAARHVRRCMGPGYFSEAF